MRAAIAIVLASSTACTPVKRPEQPTPTDPDAAVESGEAKPIASPGGDVEQRDGGVTLAGMVVPTRARDERTVEALAVSLSAAKGAGWLDLRLAPEVSDDAGFDYLHCHELALHTDTKSGSASSGQKTSAWSATLSSRHTVDKGKEIIEAVVSIDVVKRLGDAAQAGGRVCEDEFTFDAEQKAKLLALVEAIGPVTNPTQPAFEPESPWGRIGIAECDEYLTKYLRCIEDRVPEAARASMKDAMQATANAWREAAAGPGKDGLATACKAALDAAKQATAAMGCEW